MKILSLLTTFALGTCLILTACNEEKVVKTAREVGEEGADFVEKVGPESEVSGTPAVPPATISVEETITSVSQSGGLLKLAPGVATAVIDRWVETLRGNPLVDDNDLLVENLVALKMELGQSNINGEKVGEYLENLARETEQAAEDNDNEMVEKLAQVLEEAAEALD